MTFKPCILIPIYNHKDGIVSTVARLKPHALPVLIVNDGSDAATRQVLEKMAAADEEISLFHLPTNAGKGAAVMHGMREAWQAGFSHALQIDADGQHDVADVPKFIAAGREKPQHVICGKPVYDASIPKGRRYGRYITHFWVWVETLSCEIGDSMCGFRLYPLQASCELIASVNMPRRMDFDTAVLVHLVWRGVACINIPTRVTYPADGISHFHMFKDNWRITKMHTGLFFGMLWRLPLLLRRLRGNSQA